MPEDDIGSDRTVIATPSPPASGEDTLPAPDVAGEDPTLPPASGEVPTLGPAPSNDATLPAGTHATRRTEIPESDRYAFGDEFARGGIGRIRKAQDRRLGREVAVKELLAVDGGTERRFLFEAEVTAQLQHPGIIPVHDLSRHGDGRPYFCMKLVDGRDLAEVIGERDSLPERLSLLPHVIDVADALAFAHSKRIIHRDLKPQNVLVGQFGETVTIDWGLAKNLATSDSSVESKSTGPIGEGDMTQAGSIMGTLSYMPPEQAAGETLDESADVYSLGAILYHVLTGQRPFAQWSGLPLLNKVLEAEPDDVADLVPEAPPALVAIVRKAMARERSRRYESAEAFARDLRDFQTGRLVGAHKYSPWEVIKLWIRKNRAAVSVAGVAAGVLVVGTVVAFLAVAEQRDRAEEEKERAEVREREAAAEREKANDAMAHLLVERGRDELLAGKPDRALAYLVGPYSRRPDDLAVGVLVRQAIEGTHRLVRRLGAPEARVLQIRYSPAGDRLATISEAGRVEILNSLDGGVQSSFEISSSSGESFSAAVFSADLSRVAAKSEGGCRIQVLDLGSGEDRTLEGGQCSISDFTFDSGGKLLGAATSYGKPKLWDVERSVLVHEFPEHRDAPLGGVALDPDGTVIGFIDADRRVRVYSVATGARLGEFFGLDSAVLSTINIASGAEHLHAAGVLYDLEKQTKVRELGAGVVDARFYLGGKALAVADANGGLGAYDVRTGETLPSPNSLSEERITALDVTPDGDVWATLRDKEAELYSVSQGVRFFDVGDVTGLGFQVRISPDLQTLVTRTTTGTMLWRVPRAREHVVSSSGTSNAIALSPDGKLYATADRDDVARIWQFGEAEPMAVIAHEDLDYDYVAVAFSPDGSKLAAVQSVGGVTIWDVEKGEAVGVVQTASEDDGFVRFSPDGSVFAVRGQDGVDLRDVASGELRRALKRNGAKAHDVDFDTEGARLVVAYGDEAVLFDVQSGQPVREFTGHRAAATAVDIDPTGRLLVTGGMDATARLWDLESGRMIAVLAGHAGGVRSVRFDPSGRLLATCALDDRVLKTWETSSQRPVAMFDAGGPYCADIEFHPKNPEVFALQAGKLRRWSLERETRSVSEVQEIAEVLPWSLDGGVLVPTRATD